MSTRTAGYVTVPDHLQPFVLSTPALFGEMVCQGHADVCAILGHGFNRRDGVEQGFCARCGTSTVTAS